MFNYATIFIRLKEEYRLNIAYFYLEIFNVDQINCSFFLQKLFCGSIVKSIRHSKLYCWKRFYNKSCRCWNSHYQIWQFEHIFKEWTEIIFNQELRHLMNWFIVELIQTIKYFKSILQSDIIEYSPMDICSFIFWKFVLDTREVLFIKKATMLNFLCECSCH
jgi:hypothetical protein